LVAVAKFLVAATKNFFAVPNFVAVKKKQFRVETTGNARNVNVKAYTF